LLVASFVPGAARPQSRPVRIPSFGAGVSLVRISVVVRDKNGAPVRGLKREDFTITEDDKPQAVEVFEYEEVTTERAAEPEPSASASPEPGLLKPGPAPSAAPSPSPDKPATPTTDLAGRRLLVLLFDTNGMQPEQIERAVGSGREYVDQRMTAADLVAVASIGTGLQVQQDFTADRDLLRRALGRVMGTEDTTDAGAPVDASADASDTADTGFTPDTTELDLFNIDRRLRAIEDLAKALAPVVQKKSIIYFSGGMSGIGADNQVELRAAIDRAVKANLSIYPVDARGLQAVVPGGDASQASGRGSEVFSGRALTRQFDRQSASQDTLASLASDTGGKAFFDVNQFGGVFDRVVSDTSAYYVLGFTSTNPARDGRFRRIKVRVGRTDLRVEHRSGYYAERDFAHARREDREQQLQDQLLSDLSATDFPVWLQTGHFRTGENRFYVPLSVAVPGAALPPVPPGGQERATFDVIGVVRDEAKRAVARLRDTIHLSGDNAQDVRRKNVQYGTGFTVPPGKYRLKVVVRENQGGGFGSFETDFTVPDLRRSPLKVSSVVLGTQLQQAPRREVTSPLVRDGSELVPSVTHVVSARQPLYFYYELYDPAKTPQGEVKVLTSIAFYRGQTRRYETALAEVKQITAPDRNAVLFQLSVPAASLKPGFYVCQVNLIDDVAGSFTFPRLALLVRP
jgi:VWFA-related protein